MAHSRLNTDVLPVWEDEPSVKRKRTTLNKAANDGVEELSEAQRNKFIKRLVDTAEKVHQALGIQVYIRLRDPSGNEQEHIFPPTAPTSDSCVQTRAWKPQTDAHIDTHTHTSGDDSDTHTVATQKVHAVPAPIPLSNTDVHAHADVRTHSSTADTPGRGVRRQTRSMSSEVTSALPAPATITNTPNGTTHDKSGMETGRGGNRGTPGNGLHPNMNSPNMNTLDMNSMNMNSPNMNSLNMSMDSSLNSLNNLVMNVDPSMNMNTMNMGMDPSMSMYGGVQQQQQGGLDGNLASLAGANARLSTGFTSANQRAKELLHMCEKLMHAHAVEMLYAKRDQNHPYYEELERITHLNTKTTTGGRRWAVGKVPPPAWWREHIETSPKNGHQSSSFSVPAALLYDSAEQNRIPEWSTNDDKDTSKDKPLPPWTDMKMEGIYQSQKLQRIIVKAAKKYMSPVDFEDIVQGRVWAVETARHYKPELIYRPTEEEGGLV